MGFACVLAAAIPDSLILTRLDVLYRTKPKIHVSSLVAVAVMNNNLEPRAPIAKVVPTGFYYFAITAARFLDEVKEIRRETNDFVTRSIFSTMKRDLPTHSILLRQGACYFFGLWITMNALLGSRLYLSMRSHGLARNNGNTTRMRAISLELEYKEYKDEEYKDSVQRAGLRLTQA
ncbi:hypothetical protein D9756_005468 [Leucocoprinus leucothites]|uniref:Uncharacterized protein n=1 Tax=Leucocoprinus leucothites TaxID=201217 RepID=A0A8H5FZU5_9AGAR|nr:hypothetical protein D9756_005468 [Leucoagaricus leucothites]